MLSLWLDIGLILGGIIGAYLIFSWVMEKIADWIGYGDD